MKAYIFRISSEENDDFLREIEILGDQSFLDFHDFIVDVCNLHGNELASFYQCDSSWNKLNEISLMDMTIDEEPKRPNSKYVDDDDEDENYKNMPLKVMEDTMIGDIIKKEHQNLLYEYDFLSPVLLYIECIGVTKTESDDYPVCILKKGELAQNTSNTDFYDDDELEENEEYGIDDELRDEFNDLMDGEDDGDYY